MPILFDILSKADQKKIQGIMPKNWKVKRPEPPKPEIKVTEQDIKDMSKAPEGKQ